MTYRGVVDGDHVWTCDAPPALAPGMVAAQGARCGKELRLDVELVYLALGERTIGDELAVDQAGQWCAPEWQFLALVAGGLYRGDLPSGRVMCPMHHLDFLDEGSPGGKPLPTTLAEVLGYELERTVAATYERLGLKR